MRLFYFYLFVIIISTLSCHNRYNDMIDWAESVPKGSSVEYVQEIQPDYLDIAWARPDTLPFQSGQDSLMREVRYDVEVKRHYDVLQMQNTLIFVGGRYVGREVKK